VSQDLGNDALAERMRRGEQAAFVTLTSRYWTGVQRLARNLLSDPSRAREVAQEVFLRALRSPEWFPRDAPFKVSLYRLTIMLCLSRHQPRPTLGGESLLPQFDGGGRLVVPEADLSELAESPDLTEQIREGLQDLDPQDRAAFVLRVVEQVPLEEAAEILRAPHEEIRARAHRACLSLTGFLARLSNAA
jgi:RNA polymerase sigma-70 factor (ECF subfamily)